MQIEITKLEDILAGDLVSVTYKGHTVSGVAWESHEHDNTISIGATPLAWDGIYIPGRVPNIELTLVSAHRTVELPMDIGAVVQVNFRSEPIHILTRIGHQYMCWADHSGDMFTNEQVYDRVTAVLSSGVKMPGLSPDVETP